MGGDNVYTKLGRVFFFEGVYPFEPLHNAFYSNIIKCIFQYPSRSINVFSGKAIFLHSHEDCSSSLRVNVMT